jgi:threonine/homoserine efflux transporter RhtA
MKKGAKTFWCLFGAYVISMSYQYYRYTLHEHPADTFGATEITGYAVLLGWSALALVEKRWATVAVTGLCILQLAIGCCYYFPVVFATRHSRFWDWAEAVVFVGLIAYAGWRSVALLVRGRRRQPCYH